MATTVDQKLLKATKFPPEFNQKVDMQKVNLEVMRKWIAGKISDILGSEDDVVIELCFNLIEGSRYPEIKKLQIQLTGFLEKDTPAFCKELWKLCLSAQNSPQGVPKELLEAKKLELIQEKLRKLLKKQGADAKLIANVNETWTPSETANEMSVGGADMGCVTTTGAEGVEIVTLGVVVTIIEGDIDDLAHLDNGVARPETRTHAETATAAVAGEVDDTAQIAAAEGHTHHPTLVLRPQHRGNAGDRHLSPKAALLRPSLAKDAETAAAPAPALILVTAPFHGHPSEASRRCEDKPR
ncbi:hypothetical protein V492_07535 [Pseudogymnoascus sp. VKM F-4246]|nr:hypothetical protein V492_07535 [Pseudogymnoascus sp. VKM F-4246]